MLLVLYKELANLRNLDKMRIKLFDACMDNLSFRGRGAFIWHSAVFTGRLPAGGGSKACVPNHIACTSGHGRASSAWAPKL